MQGSGGPLPATATVGENPPNGAAIYFWLKNKAEATLEFLDAAGKSIRKFSTADRPAEERPSGEEEEGGGRRRGGRQARLTAEAGLNRFVWNLQHEEAKGFPGMILWAGYMNGPAVVPGEYQVKLTVAGKTQTQRVLVKKDPRVPTSPEEFAQQLALHLQIRDKLTETNQSVDKIRQVRKQIEDLSAQWKDLPAARRALEQGKQLVAKLTTIEEALYQTQNRSSQDPLNYPIRLNNRLAALAGVVASADAGPTRQSQLLFEELASAINGHLKQLNELLGKELAAFNKRVVDDKLPAVVLK